jgi:hypothetical protein
MQNSYCDHRNFDSVDQTFSDLIRAHRSLHMDEEIVNISQCKRFLISRADTTRKLTSTSQQSRRQTDVFWIVYGSTSFMTCPRALTELKTVTLKQANVLENRELRRARP